MSDLDDQYDELGKRILDAAESLFIHYGFDKTTVSDIVQVSGVSKSTIYQRWKKKEDIFEALLWRESQKLLQKWLCQIHADPQGGSFSAIYRYALEALLENSFLLAVYRRDRRFLGSLIQRMGGERLYLQRQKMLMHFFTSLQDVGAVRSDVDAHTLSYLLNSIQYGLIQMGELIPEEESPDIEQTLEMIVSMIEQFIIPEKGGDTEAGKAIVEEFAQQAQVMLKQRTQE